MSKLVVGVSGWRYAGWRGDFYPSELPARRHLEYTTRLLGAVEVNGTFYSLKSPTTYARWYEDSTDDAIFALKGSRYITHILRLREPKVALANFFANGLLRLEDKLGPLLWQLPPRMPWDAETFARFCEMLPDDTQAAAKLGRAHDARVSGKVSLVVDRNRRLRHAFEIRDPRVFQADALRVLERLGHALVFADTAGRFPYHEDITAGFVYVRLHGAEELYFSGYDDDSLRSWAHRIDRWAHGGCVEGAPCVRDKLPPRRKSRDVYVFFDNDAKVHAPFDALRLHAMLGQPRDPLHLVDDEGVPMPPPPRLLRGPTP